MPLRIPAASTLLAACCLFASAVGCDRASPPPPAATPPAQPTAADSAPPAADPAATPAPAPAKPDRSTFGPLIAVFEQSSGIIRVDLAARETPRVCANFVNLCERGYYDGRPWGDFSTVVRQTGPTDPAEEPAYTLAREFAPKLLFDVGGNLCMSNTSDEPGARARATRIFITVKPQERWNLVYSVFGRISSGLDIAQRLTPGETITRVRIEGDTAPIKAAYAAEIAQWNKALDAARPAVGGSTR